jgi:hypothetical protein
VPCLSFHGIGASIVELPGHVIVVVDFLHLLRLCLHVVMYRLDKGLDKGIGRNGING